MTEFAKAGQLDGEIVVPGQGGNSREFVHVEVGTDTAQMLDDERQIGEKTQHFGELGALQNVRPAEDADHQV